MSFFKRIFGRATPPDNTAAPSFEEYATKVFPWVKVSSPGAGQSTFELTGEQAPVYRPWLGDLIIVYA